MSRFDKEHERQWAEAAARDARDFVVGATVYRHHFGIIEVGTVRVVARCDDPDYGDKPNGKNPYYAAEFIRSPGCSGTWVSQTYARRFVATKDAAVKQLIEYLDQNIEDAERNIKRKRAEVEAIRAGRDVPVRNA